MSVTGPDFNSNLSNIQAVDTLRRMGNDSYTATTGSIVKEISEELYDCTASNGVSSHTGSVGLKGACIYSCIYPLGKTTQNMCVCVCVCVYVHVLGTHDQYD